MSATRAERIRTRVEGPALAPLTANGNGDRPAVTAVPETLVLDAREPYAIAQRLIRDRYMLGDVPLLRAWREDVYAYDGSCYRPLDVAGTRSTIYHYLEPARQLGRRGDVEPFRPTATTVNNVVDALRAAAHLDTGFNAPGWLDGRTTPAPNELLACADGLLHYPTRTLHPSSPLFFTTHALPFEYRLAAGDPVEWLTFLHSLWPDDQAAIDTLQEMFGYIVAGDCRQQKMFLLVGPKRAGKDTIARILRLLIGPENVAGPTLSGLSGPFGLQMLIGKPLAIIADARLSGRADQAVIAERLLAITGQGHLSVERKHREAWNGELATRFLILSNELPRLEDASGALASRFIVLTLTRSWYGREDTSLYSRLAAEVPAILSWALNGLDRLVARGRFTTPASSANAVQELEDLGSPVKQFVRERCTLHPLAEVDTRTLYTAWAKWCTDHGRSHVSTQQIFGRDLRAAFPDLDVGSRVHRGNRWRAYVGIRLVEELSL